MTNTTPTLYRLTPIDDVEGLEDGWYIVKTTDGDAHEMLFDKKEWHGKYEPYAYLRPLPPGTQVLPPGMVAVSEDIISNLPENMPLYKDSGLWQLRTDDMEDVILQQTAVESFKSFLSRCAEYYLTKLAQMGE